jgi:CBS domain-containing protein
MGLVTSLISFGAGYAAGMRLGDRPIVAARDAMGQARERAGSASPLASRLMGSSGGAGRDGTIDVRDVREVMTATPETVDVGASLRDAAALMDEDDIGSVIVTEDGTIAGIITDRDIAVRGVASGADPKTQKVRDAMTPSPVTVQPTATVQEAIDVMRHHDVRRVPVVEGGRPIGVVALADLAITSQARSLLEDISSAPPNN